MPGRQRSTLFPYTMLFRSLANKAERSAAESVERRARAEGSAVQRHTRVGHSAGVGAPIAGLLRADEHTSHLLRPVYRICAHTLDSSRGPAMIAPTALRPSR